MPMRGMVLSYGKPIHLVDTLRALKPGQSFVVDTASARANALDTAGRLGIHITTEQQGGRYRIWRKE